MELLALFKQDPTTFFMLIGLLLYSIIMHEIAHGLVALWFGDRTASSAGRLTLNPVKHVDPIGALMLFVVGFGWARPVPVNYRNLRPTKLGIICVALAGCTINIILAITALFLMQFDAFISSPLLLKMLLIVAKINVILAVFNLIPIPPLDGSKVLMEFLPRSIHNLFLRIEPYGFLIILALLYTGVLSPVIDSALNLLYRGIALFLAN